jgi:cytochrome b561
MSLLPLLMVATIVLTKAKVISIGNQFTVLGFLNFPQSATNFRQSATFISIEANYFYMGIHFFLPSATVIYIGIHFLQPSA